MQRYRVNYHLLIGLFVGSIVASVALYFLWRWQLDRKAVWYRERSQAALEEDNQLEAFEYLEKFVKLRTDDNQARVELAAIAADILEMEGVDRESQALAFGILDQTVRRTGDPAARRKIADLLFRSGRPQDAITHYEELLKDDPDNAELKSLRVQAMFRGKAFNKAAAAAFELIGYDTETETFDTKKAEAADQPKVYSTLASYLIQREHQPELAAKVIDQMVAVNPDSAVAHLERSTYLYSDDKKEEAAAELDQAYQLDPENSDVLYRQGAVASDEKKFEAAREIATTGIEKYPDEMRFYRLLANAELGLKEYDKAIAALDQGVRQFSKERSLEFLALKIEILLSQNDIEATEEVIDEMEKMQASRLKPFIDFQRARITFQQGKMADAAQQLQRVRPQLVGFGRNQVVAGALLAEAYEKLGKLDLALQMFQLVRDDETVSSEDPVKKMARARVKQIEERLGIAPLDAPASDLNAMVQEMLAKPEDEQDWEEIEATVQEIVDKRGLSEAKHKLLQAQVFSQRKMPDEAKQAVRDAAKLDPQDVSVRFAAVKLLMIEPPTGPPKALELLERIERENGVTVQSRRLKVEAVAAVGGEDVKDRLRALTEGTDDWSDANKAPFLASIGLKFLQLGDAEEAVRYLNQAAELAPDNLPIRVQMFDIAFQQRDEEAMLEAQQKILDLVKTKEDGNYVLTEVKRRLIGADGQQVNREDLLEARKMLDAALERRPQWHELHVLYGQLLLILNEETDLALQHLNDALKYGPPNPAAVGIQVKLLAQRGDIAQAREKMDYIPESIRGRLLGRTEATVLAAVGEADAAFRAAQKEVERHPDDASTQDWYGSLALNLGKLDEAAAAYRKACDLNPSDQETWMKLVSVYAQQQDPDKIEVAFRDAQLALDPEFLPLIQAKFFELQGRWKNAEDIYFSVYGDRLDNPAIAQRMAGFYMFWANVEPKMAKQAAPFINRILRAANEGHLQWNDPTVAWAREKAASYLASTGRYQDAVKALRVLKQGTPDGKVPREFQTLYSKILSSRTDPVSILAAIEMLSERNQQGLLSKNEALLLAKLYARTNNWKLGKALMLDSLSLYPSDQDVWTTYISLLIGQKEYTQTSRRLTRFEDITDNEFAVFQLRTLLAHERGDQAEVKKLLRSMLPRGLGPATPLDEDQLKTIKAIAGLAVGFEEYELSEQLLRLYISRTKEGVADLVNVMALYGNVDEALPMMKQLSTQAPVAMAQLAVQVLRQRRLELGDRYDDQVDELVEAALQDDPESGERLVTRAEMFEVMEKYDEAIKAYEKVLNRDDLPENGNAAVMNNLAFLLAQTNQRLDEAQELIDDAIEILGPLSDALDTRAVVRMARKEYDLAVEDMTLALAVDPSAVKYYHLAKAQALAGNAEAALEAWQAAQDLGIEKESLTLIEQPGFSETEQLIKNLTASEAS